jgi:FkbM family methyltransferase
VSRLIYEEVFENDELTFLERYLKEGDVFIDVGANIGIFSLVAAKMVGATGKVISFEPTLSTFQRLNENIILNNFTNILPINAAGNKNEEQTIYKNNFTQSSSLLEMNDLHKAAFPFTKEPPVKEDIKVRT